MGDTEHGSWGSDQLEGHIRQEEARMARTVSYKYLVVSYDLDQAQWFYDTVLAKDATAAEEFICKLRPYVVDADASTEAEFDKLKMSIGVTDWDANEVLSECQSCEGVFPQSRLQPIKHIGQRVEAGEPMPSGECPQCGALCQPLEAAK